MNRMLATIDLIESHVNKVAKGTGKPYTCTVLHYVVNGEHKEKMIVDKAMRDHIVNNFHSGDTVVMTFEKNEKGFPDLVSMEHDDGSYKAEPHNNTTTNTKTTYASNNNDRDLGMQVGNALTNAATLLASGQMSGSLESVAEEVIRTGERLKARLAAGELK